VHVLGHDHVARDHKAISSAHALGHFQQQIAMLRFLQQRETTITAGGDEAEISPAVVTMELVGHQSGVTRYSRCGM
jgi:hypothetical protein